MSVPGIKQVGAKWLYREERYTMLDYWWDDGQRWFRIYKREDPDVIHEISEKRLDENFTPLIEIGQVYGYPRLKGRFIVDDIYTSIYQGKSHKLFVKIVDGDQVYDILYDDMLDLMDEDGLMLVTKVDMSGATCKKCNQFFEYANFAIDFKCWACKNGY